MFETRKKLKAEIKELTKFYKDLVCELEKQEKWRYKYHGQVIELETKAEKALNFIKSIKCKDSCATNGGLLPLCNRCSMIKGLS